RKSAVVLPCKHIERVVAQVQPTKNLLTRMDELHPHVVKEIRQLYLFDEEETVPHLDPRLWHGSFNGRESTLQQVSPYVGKMKSGMARVLINLYSRPGETVLDPFSGSGVVPLEAALARRRAWANDLSVYAYVLTRGKLETPGSEGLAIQHA